MHRMCVLGPKSWKTKQNAGCGCLHGPKSARPEVEQAASTLANPLAQDHPLPLLLPWLLWLSDSQERSAMWHWTREP
jgi:hypothetical protein